MADSALGFDCRIENFVEIKGSRVSNSVRRRGERNEDASRSRKREMFKTVVIPAICSNPSISINPPSSLASASRRPYMLY